MPLSPGDKLGPYEISAPIGAGGMGEVWKAHDPRVGRDVAVKVSKDEYTERFTREARAIGAVNHTNVCHLYDVGPNYIVLEYVEGATLQGPLPLDDAMPIIRQLIEGIEAAHEKNIVHRDLKPANIKITPNGTVKILDFGLAKATDPERPSEASPENSPTVTIGATVAGTILGTAAYMSPEQAKGKRADRRSDIWSFGAVVYELLTGNKPFVGETAVEILGAVMNQEPDWAPVPQRMRRLLQRCLQKDRKNRLDSIADARWMIEESAVAESAPSVVAKGRPSRPLPWMLAAGVFFAGAASLAVVHFREALPTQQSLRFQIAPPGTGQPQFPTLSPDGRMLAFVTSNGGPNQVWVRALDSLEPRALAGTDGATYPFWSPDGAYLGFFAESKLRKIAIAGGPRVTLCDAVAGRGGTWNRNGVILFSPGPGSQIFRVSAAGGVPTPVTQIRDGGGHRFPVFLPDGVHFLFNSASNKAETSGVFVGSLNGAEVTRLLPDGTNALYTPPPIPGASGHLLFRRELTLMAQPFDQQTLQFAAEMFPVAEDVAQTGNNGFGAFWVSANSTLAFVSRAAETNTTLEWLDRAGKRLGIVGKPSAYRTLAMSPDEKTAAVTIGEVGGQDIWQVDLARSVVSRFTFLPGANFGPIWSPDGSRLAFTSRANGVLTTMYQKPASGNGKEEPLLPGGVNGVNRNPLDWSPDGKWIVYQDQGEKTGFDLWFLPMEGEHKPVPYLQTAFDEANARFSPDGKWIAYQSNESGQYQIYVQSVPPSGAKYQISLAGGAVPLWRRDGKELFFVSADQKLMAVSMKLGSTVEPGTPKPLFGLPSRAPGVGSVYRPSRDGQRFLVIVPAGGENIAATPFTIVTNWQAGLKK